MNIREELLREHSKLQSMRIADYIGADQERFDKLMDLFLNDEWRVNQRAAWVLSYCADHHPFLISKHLEKLIRNLRNPVHDAVKRNTVRVLESVDIPEALLAETLDICFTFLCSKTEPIAVKVHAMTVLANIAKKEPDLKAELRLVIEEQLPYGSAAFLSRARHTLRKL